MGGKVVEDILHAEAKFYWFKRITITIQVKCKGLQKRLAEELVGESQSFIIYQIYRNLLI